MAALPPWVQPAGADAALLIHVQPGARRAAVGGAHGDRLKVAVTAPALEGRANAAVLAVLARQLGVARRWLTLTAGEHARDKRVVVAAGAGLDAGAIAQRLAAPA